MEVMTHTLQPTAVITGASKGLGRALAHALAARGWRLIVDARNSSALARAVADLPSAVAIRGDVTDPEHRQALGDAVERAGRLDLLVNNASDLGPTPLPPLGEYRLGALRAVYREHRGRTNWEKTAHTGAHRGPSPARLLEEDPL